MDSGSGMSFAQTHMAKCGWKEGRGLGREETGRTDPIKVKLKFDNAGFGHDQAEEFTFQWWDHVFNKAADNLSVSKNEKGGIEVHQKEKLVVSKSRPSAALAAMKEKLYGSFVKGGTLRGSDEVSTKDSSDSSDEDDEPRDMSMKLSDDQLFKLCGGRTAHKGARHGLNMNAKLERVRLQEEELLRKWKGEAQKDTPSQLNSSLSNDIENTGKATPTEKKRKKKKHKEVFDESLSIIEYEDTKNPSKYNSDEENSCKKKKKKKKKHSDQDTMHDDSGIESVVYEIKGNRDNSKKKKKCKEKKGNEGIEECESKTNNKREFELDNEEQSKKKKKKSKKNNDVSNIIPNEICCDNPDITSKKKEKDKLDICKEEEKKKKKKKKPTEIDEYRENTYNENGINIDEENLISTEGKKKKKKKKEKPDYSETEEVEVKMKKKKKSKTLKENECEENEGFKDKKKKSNEEISHNIEIRELKKKRKAKDIEEMVSNLENKASKKIKNREKIL